MPATALFMIMLGIVFGTMTVITANHWLTAWLGLELNMISVLPMITKQKHPRSTEAATKYFLIQATASSIMLLSSTLNAWKTGTWEITQLNDKLSCILMISALTMKMGAAPLHFWLPEVMQGTTLNTALLITTWQKIAPITLLYMISNHSQMEFTLLIGTLSILIGGWGGINQTQLRKMMAYSSVAHLGWTMAVISIAPNTALLNIIIYMIISTPMFLLLMNAPTKTLQATTTIWSFSPTTAILLTLLLLSMAALPPLAGFTPKLLIMDKLILHKLAPTTTVLALSSLLSLVFYLRMTYLMGSTIPPTTTQSTTLWRLKPNHNQLTTMLTPLALFNITIMPALMM
uniref:NADH-ubiquinone oxidoreductase chain 2 n=1 Tax=Hypsilurus papuensis TaxID=206596 RepID=Q7Y9G5_9SAUR|nr:NADH dehydrogenase subunit 2 [Hypsilurus papuensis]